MKMENDSLVAVIFHFWKLKFVKLEELIHHLPMKKLFYPGLVFLLVFEIARLYFIMPMPGSQQMNSVDWAHFLHAWRWAFRGIAGLMILMGTRQAWKGNRWILGIATALVVAVTGFLNLKLSADKMFLQPIDVIMVASVDNRVPMGQLVLGITSRAKPAHIPYSSWLITTRSWPRWPTRDSWSPIVRFVARGGYLSRWSMGNWRNSGWWA